MKATAAYAKKSEGGRSAVAKQQGEEGDKTETMMLNNASNNVTAQHARKEGRKEGGRTRGHARGRIERGKGEKGRERAIPIWKDGTEWEGEEGRKAACQALP